VTRRIEQRIRAAREQHPEFEGKTITFGPVVGGKIYVVNRERDASSTLLSALGFTLSPQISALPESFRGAEISLEQVSLLETGVIMLNPGTPDDRHAVESNELFQRLEAVRRGSYIALDLANRNRHGLPVPAEHPRRARQDRPAARRGTRRVTTAVPELARAAGNAPGRRDVIH
jgi:ABC-type Fe3+-hydroxamate transport system substrate-binding protein